MTINLSLFNIISVHFHRFGPPLTRTCIPARIRQRSEIEFLTAEGEMPIRIHERLKNVYSDSTVDVSTVRRWVCRCKEAEGQKGWLTKRGVAGRPAAAFYRAGIHALC